MSLHELTDEQRAVRDLARQVAEERIAPQAAAWDRAHTFPRELFRELGELGLMGVCVPYLTIGSVPALVCTASVTPAPASARAISSITST